MERRAAKEKKEINERHFQFMANASKDQYSSLQNSSRLMWGMHMQGLKELACAGESEHLADCVQFATGKAGNPSMDNVPGQCFSLWRDFQTCFMRRKVPSSFEEFQELVAGNMERQYVARERESEAKALGSAPPS